MSNLVVKELKYIYLFQSISYRTKVDLTKYIEEHNFNFDNVFDDGSDNHEVCQHNANSYYRFTKYVSNH